MARTKQTARRSIYMNVANDIQISLNKYDISANIVDRYASIVYSFDFVANSKSQTVQSSELSFEITIDCDAFISHFIANIDGVLFYGKTKEKEEAKQEYNTAKENNQNAILIYQPHKNIPNVFTISTNINSKSSISLSINIEQYLKKKFNYNNLNIQLLNSFNQHNILQNYDCITFHLDIKDQNTIHDIKIPSSTLSSSNNSNNNRNSNSNESNVAYDILIDEQTTDDSDHHYVINGRVMHRRMSLNELILNYKASEENKENESNILYDNKSNTFCHIISYKNDEIKDNILIPRRVVFVIDRSGSMSGSKWDKTISSTNATLKQLRVGYDRFCVILC
eukprot:525151_1